MYKLDTPQRGDSYEYITLFYRRLEKHPLIIPIVSRPGAVINLSDLNYLCAKILEPLKFDHILFHEAKRQYESQIVRL